MRPILVGDPLGREFLVLTRLGRERAYGRGAEETGRHR